jgi:hypothetical protein
MENGECFISRASVSSALLGLKAEGLGRVCRINRGTIASTHRDVEPPSGRVSARSGTKGRLTLERSAS